MLSFVAQPFAIVKFLINVPLILAESLAGTGEAQILIVSMIDGDGSVSFAGAVGLNVIVTGFGGPPAGGGGCPPARSVHIAVMPSREITTIGNRTLRGASQLRLLMNTPRDSRCLARFYRRPIATLYRSAVMSGAQWTDGVGPWLDGV